LFSHLELLEFTGLTQVYARPHNFYGPPFSMSFDEELERTLDALADRLHEEVARQVRTVAVELAAAAGAERAALTVPSPAVAAAQIAPAPAESSAGRLAEGVRALSLAPSLSDILETLVNESGRSARRVALLLVRPDADRFQGWRFLGFDLSGAPHRSFDVSRADAGAIAEAADAGAPAGTGPAPAFARLRPEDACLALPLVIAREAVAVLYADGFESSEDTGAGASTRERLEVLALHASRCLESLTAIKAAAALVAPPDEMSDAADEDPRVAASTDGTASDREEQARA